MAAWAWWAAFAAVSAAGAAPAQELGSMEVRLGGQDHTFLVLGEEEGTAVEGSDGRREVTLVAVPEPEPGAEEPERRPRLTLGFVVEGVGGDATLSEPRIAFADARGRDYVTAQGMTGSVTLDSVTEIGASFIMSGGFSAELVPEGGGDSLGASGDFQTTFELE